MAIKIASASVSTVDEISIKMTITLGGEVHMEGSVLIVYIIQPFQKFFVSPFVNFLPLSGQPYANHLWKPWQVHNAALAGQQCPSGVDVAKPKPAKT